MAPSTQVFQDLKRSTQLANSFQPLKHGHKS